MLPYPSVPNMFQVRSDEIDRMLLSLAEENEQDLQDEIQHLSRSWIAAVMGQPYRKNKNQRRPFEYSKKKIQRVLKWRQSYRLLRSILPERILADGDSTKGKYANEFGTGCFYWYGTDNEGTPNLWYRMELMNWDQVNLQRGLEYNGLILQSAFNAMPQDSNVYQLNFILLLDDFNPIYAIKKPRLGPSFLKLFMKCCPDRLKRAVMVTGLTGSVLYNIAKSLAPKTLVDKITVIKDRQGAANALLDMGIVRGNAMTSRIDGDHHHQSGLPTFLGGEEEHRDEITKNLPNMIDSLRLKMATSPGGAKRILSSPSLSLSTVWSEHEDSDPMSDDESHDNDNSLAE